MIEPLKALIEALRQELQQYGEMLARLDQQQDSIMRRAADDILASVSAVQEQGQTLQQARRQREELQRGLAGAMSRGPESTLAELARELPVNYRPLVQALVEENNELLVRVQQRARQNHLLLRRSLDLMQELLRSLFPAGNCLRYNGAGQAPAPRLPACALYDAAG